MSKPPQVGQGAQRHRAAHHSSHGIDCIPRAIHFRQDGPCPGQQRLPRGSQANAAPLTDEKLGSQFAFKLLDSRRDGRLDHVQLLCPTGEAQLFGDGQEVLDLG